MEFFKLGFIWHPYLDLNSLLFLVNFNYALTSFYFILFCLTCTFVSTITTWKCPSYWNILWANSLTTVQTEHQQGENISISDHASVWPRRWITSALWSVMGTIHWTYAGLWMECGKQRVNGATLIGMKLLILCLNMLMLDSPLLIWLIYVCNATLFVTSTCT